jgi:hypothetical protein
MLRAFPHRQRFLHHHNLLKETGFYYFHPLENNPDSTTIFPAVRQVCELFNVVS